MPSPNSIVPKDSQFSVASTIDESEVLAPTLSLQDFVGILKRRRVIALNTFILVVALGIVLTLMTKPLFRTSARLLVQGKSNSVNINSNEDPLGSVMQSQSGRDVDTQIEILRSPMVLSRVFKQTQLPPGSVSIDVARVAETDVIDIVGSSTSKDGVERFLTALPQVYEKDSRDDRLREVSAALDFATKSEREQESKLRRTEKAMEQFKISKGIVDVNADTASALGAAANRREELNKAISNVASLQGQLDALNTERSRLSPFTDNPVTTTNPQIQLLKDQIASLRSDRTRLLFLYKPSDDEVRKVDLQIKDLERRLTTTPENITNNSRTFNPALSSVENKMSDVRAALQAAQSDLGSLRQQIAQQDSKLGRFNTIQTQQAQLQRDMESSSGAVKTLSDSVMELTLRKKALEAAGAPVTTMQASGPAVQVAPLVSRNIVLSVALGLLLACAAALLQESLDDRIRSEEEARRLLSTPVLGYFPKLPSARSGPILDLENPDRILLEGFRVLRSNVQFTLVNSPGKKLQVTSSVPGEGKSYVASNLAIAMALDGRRVIMVDADLHRPRMHQVFDIPREPGLTNILVGEATLEESLRDVGIPGLRLLSAGKSPPNPVELLNSPAMDALFHQLEEEADIVIFDTPPLLATADSQVMSSKVDGVIYVMQLGRVARSETQRAFELLHQANARIVGMVFNKVDEKETRSTYGGYAGYYEDSEPDITEIGTSSKASGNSEVELAPALLGNGNGTLDSMRANGTPNGAPPVDVGRTSPKDQI